MNSYHDNRIYALELLVKQLANQVANLAAQVAQALQGLKKLWQSAGGGGGASGSAAWQGYTTGVISAATSLHAPGAGNIMIQTLSTSGTPSLTDAASSVTGYWNGSVAIPASKPITGGYDYQGNPIIQSADC